MEEFYINIKLILYKSMIPIFNQTLLKYKEELYIFIKLKL